MATNNQYYRDAAREYDSQLNAKRALNEAERRAAVNTYNQSLKNFDHARSSALKGMLTQHRDADARQANRMAARGIDAGEGAIVNWNRMAQAQAGDRQRLESDYANQAANLATGYQNQLGEIAARRAAMDAEREAAIMALYRELEDRGWNRDWMIDDRDYSRRIDEARYADSRGDVRWNQGLAERNFAREGQQWNFDKMLRQRAEDRESRLFPHQLTSAGLANKLTQAQLSQLLAARSGGGGGGGGGYRTSARSSGGSGYSDSDFAAAMAAVGLNPDGSPMQSPQKRTSNSNLEGLQNRVMSLSNSLTGRSRLNPGYY